MPWFNLYVRLTNMSKRMQDSDSTDLLNRIGKELLEEVGLSYLSGAGDYPLCLSVGASEDVLAYMLPKNPKIIDIYFISKEHPPLELIKEKLKGKRTPFKSEKKINLYVPHVIEYTPEK